uniref:Peptidase S1 domain-containing protein n=1 Tax=Anolis carolinensis TaxID=28377 RepID=H9GC50_ANOCA
MSLMCNTFSFFIYLGAVSSQADCGQPVINPRIVGGESAPDGAWPWQVSIYEDSGHVCGGSLIASQWVLSAAHCFQKENEKELLLGAYQLSNPSPNMKMLQIQQVIPHPDYKGYDGSMGDIALVKLASPVNFTDYILPICLPDASTQFPSDSYCWVTGWGKINENDVLQSPKTLQELQVPLIGRDTCNNLFNMDPSDDIGTDPIKSDMICAGYPDGGKDACFGDSGGPLACKLSGIWNLAGVVSWGDGCAKSNRAGVYTSVPYYADWIQETMNDGPNNTPTMTLFLISLAIGLL